MTYLEIAILCLLTINLILLILVNGYVNTVNDRCGITDSQYQLIKKMIDINNKRCNNISEMIENNNERYDILSEAYHVLARHIKTDESKEE